MSKKGKKPKSLADLGAATTQAKPEVVEPTREEKELKVSPELAVLLESGGSSVPEDIFDSEKMLLVSEKELYAKRHRQYLEEFTLNKSSDRGLIHRVIMEEIISERIYKKLLSSDNTLDDKSLSERLDSSHKRYETALNALGASRDKRIKNKETDGVSIADVAKQFFDGGAKQASENRVKWSEEDEAVANQQKNYLGLQYGVNKDGEEDAG